MEIGEGIGDKEEEGIKGRRVQMYISNRMYACTYRPRWALVWEVNFFNINIMVLNNVPTKFNEKQ